MTMQLATMIRRLAVTAGLALAVLVVFAHVPTRAQAVVAMVNGAPITTFDVDQRVRFKQLSARQRDSREAALKELIDDRIKVQEARRSGFRISETIVDERVERIARGNRQTVDQFLELLRRAGVSPQVYRAKLEADIAWEALLRNRIRRGTNLTNAELEAALAEAEAKGRMKVTDYTVQSVIFVVPGNAAALAGQRLREAEAARASFRSCAGGLEALASQKDVAVRPPVTRSTNELPEVTVQVLAKTPVGSLTPPTRSPQGIEMLAVCDKAERIDRAGVRAAVEQELSNKKTKEVEDAYLAELRAGAQITRN